MRTLVLLLCGLLAAGLVSAQAPPSSATALQRVRLAPQFVPGQTFRYQMEYRTTTETRRTGLVQDPQAPAQLEITWSALVRLEVLLAEPPAAGSVRLRATYEKSSATARSDIYDPEGASLAAQYSKLQGHSIECTRTADGKVSNFRGLQDLGLPRFDRGDPKAVAAVQDWLSQISSGVGGLAREVAPGESWSSEQPAAGAPLVGLVWRTESTYLRNEPCRPAVPSDDERCAVILTRLEMSQPRFHRGQPRAVRDPTPEDYRARGLRTAGTWSGSGESLTYISLRTGWVVSSTQSGSEEMDVTVSSAEGETSVRYAGRVRSQSQISLLPQAAPPPSTPRGGGSVSE